MSESTPRVAVLGASGMLGSMLVAYLSRYYSVVATTRRLDYLSLGPPPAVTWRYYTIDMPPDFSDCDWVINAIGAIPQRNPGCATYLAVNAGFAKRLAELSTRNGTRVIQIATDCVYCGDSGGYAEDAPHSPVDDYGHSKSLGEVSGPTTLRCSVVGHGPRDDYSLLGRFLSHPQGAMVKGYTNHQWNGLTTLHFAKICRAVIETGITWDHRVHHVVPGDQVSKCQLLDMFRRYFRQDIKVRPSEAAEPVDRTLATAHPDVNRQLWEAAGYREPPTIRTMVKEMAEWGGKV